MKLLLLGDVCSTETSAALFAQADTDALFGDVRTLFDACDYSFVNLETAITESEHRIQKFGPNLKSPLQTAEALRKLGVDCCGLSNNHIFDFGIEGAQDTLRALDAAQITYTGFGSNYEDSRKNLIIRRGDETIALITVCEHEYSYALEHRMGSRPYHEYDTMEDIRAAKAECDRVIVIYHGGKEYCKYPSPRVRSLFRAMAKNGADLVIGQHSHCVATYEQYEGGHLLHGQGNFHFAGNDQLGKLESWFYCLAVVYDTVTHSVDFVPISADGASVALSKGEERERILREFSLRNLELQNGVWKQKWHEFCVSMQENYLRAISNACRADSTDHDNALFAHYLDCEAHTDVWRELFPTYNQTNEL